MPGLTAVGFYLISLIFGVIIFSLWLRIALRFLRVSRLTQLSQLVLTITNPLVNPIKLLLKQPDQPGQKYDWSAFITLFIIELMKIICLSLIAFHALMPLTYLLIFIVADLIIQPCDILFYAILIRVIMSYVNPAWRHPIADFLYALTQPLLIIGRRIIPDVSGFDFSPFIMMIILKVITLFISSMLPWRLI